MPSEPDEETPTAVAAAEPTAVAGTATAATTGTAAEAAPATAAVSSSSSSSSSNGLAPGGGKDGGSSSSKVAGGISSCVEDDRKQNRAPADSPPSGSKEQDDEEEAADQQEVTETTGLLASSSTPTSSGNAGVGNAGAASEGDNRGASYGGVDEAEAEEHDSGGDVEEARSDVDEEEEDTETRRPRKPCVYAVLKTFSLVAVAVSSTVFVLQILSSYVVREGMFAQYLIRFYISILCVMFVLSELGVEIFLNWCPAMEGWFNRGFLYTLVGVIVVEESFATLGQAYPQLPTLDVHLVALLLRIFSSVMFGVGVIYMLLGILRLRNVYDNARTLYLEELDEMREEGEEEEDEERPRSRRRQQRRQRRR